MSGTAEENKAVVQGSIAHFESRTDFLVTSRRLSRTGGAELTGHRKSS
jgi:hypothetical protein